MIRAAVLLVLLTGLAPGAASAPAPPQPGERVVGLPCEGCEAIFVGMPAELGWETRLAPPGIEGQPLVLEGTVRDRKGQPAPGIIVYAYQANAGGVYPPDDRTRGTTAERHGALRGWVKTDARGRYRFMTIRPGGYPESADPQHIHMHVLEPGRCTYYIDSVHFDDDPRLTSVLRLKMLASRGGRGIVTPARDASGRWRARRDIRLGQGIPDYDDCARR
jgi:protocatechuate 3,4-dioxygenase beta subunit